MDQPTANAPGPLSHLRVLDFTALVQGPLATQILGDLGADVVKIERTEGEWSRHWGILDGHTHGQTDSFLAFNRNKRSVTADLKDEQARERILALAAEFDVVVENHGSIWATAPFGLYPTADGGIAIAMTPCPIVGRALDLPDLARYDTNALMLEHRAEIYAALAARLKTGTTARWLEALLADDVWCAPIQDYDDLVQDPQALHNSMFWEVPIGDGSQSFRAPASPFVFSATPVAIHRGVPDLGEHTEEIFGQEDS